LEELGLELQLRKLNKKEYKKIIQYAIRGMHFNAYMDSKIALAIYGKYFWYLTITNATQVIAAYYGDVLAGVIVADMIGEPKVYKSFWKSLYVKMFDWMQHTFFKEIIGIYEETNKSMLEKYKKTYKPDGEIKFLAANPDLKVRGIGTFLLQELERRERGKEVYLFTDDQCTYPFYEHRGFERVGEKDIHLELGKKDMVLKCLLYRKKISTE